MELRNIVHSNRARAVITETVLALALFFGDPLGIVAYRARVIDNSFAVLSQYNYRTMASKKLAVLLIGNDTLNSWQVDWPLTYEKTAELVHALACAGVVGVFFDFTLSKEFNLADGREQLEAATVDSSKIGPDCANGNRPQTIRVFFGKAEGINTALGAALNQEASFSIDVRADDGLYPVGKEEFPDSHVPTDEASPAFGIVRSIPQLGLDRGDDTGTPCQYSDARPKCWMKPLALVWSGSVNPNQGAVTNTEGCRGFPGWGAILASLFGLTKEGRFETCPPILTLNAEDLFRDKSYISANGNPAALLAGRFVFVGAQLAGLNDEVFSPVHGYLPGVYKHAVATDNLISYGKNYPTVPRPWLLGVMVVITYILIELIKELSRTLTGRRAILVSGVLFCLLIWSAIIFAMRWPASLVLTVFGYYVGSVLFVEAAGVRSGTPSAKSHGRKTQRPS